MVEACPSCSKRVNMFYGVGMKKTAVLIYDQFCNFEISVVLEILAMAEKPMAIIAKDLSNVKSEEGITVSPDKCIADIDINEYDSLLLPGAMDIIEAIEDDEILSLIKLFNDDKKIIGAISIAPILLVKNGVLGTKPFMAGINKEELYEEGFSVEELLYMKGWDDNLENPVEEGYIISENVITSVSYEFVRFGLAYAKMLGIDIPAETFGIRN